MRTTNGAVLVALLGATLAAIMLLISAPVLLVALGAWLLAALVVLVLLARVVAARDTQTPAPPEPDTGSCDVCGASRAACRAKPRRCCNFCTHDAPATTP